MPQKLLEYVLITAVAPISTRDYPVEIDRQGTLAEKTLAEKCEAAKVPSCTRDASSASSPSAKFHGSIYILDGTFSHISGLTVAGKLSELAVSMPQ
jgi:hypothetical protein